ncbi:universal stress protein [Halobacteria archaeon AArc-dxtr1]|nr:universal stress protein [Halobacteria archaeon AArc-dxtr1]
MTDPETEGSLLVPIANPETVDRLLDTAIDIARERSVPIVAVHVVEVPPQIPLSQGDQLVTNETNRLLEYVSERAEDDGIEIETRTRFARDTATGIVGAVNVYDAAALLMGWRGRPRRRDVILGSFLDRVLGEAPCDVYVKRIKLPTSSIDSILVPIAGGPHDELATKLAGTIATAHDAEIVLLHVEHPDVNEKAHEDHANLLRERREKLSSEHSVDETIIESDNVAGAITDETTHHDLTILGATRDPFLKRKLVGSVAQGVGRSAGSSVIVTRSDQEE